ncbi:MAG: S41 family peptidase [Alistipes indistinctus]
MLQLQKLNQFYRYLNGTYVDTVHNDALVEKAIREVLLQLDPHSTYLTAEEMKGVKEVFDGSFSGIGIEFNVLSDTVIVVNVIAGGPSEKVGLLPNDRIVKADGKNIVGTKQLDVPKILRGPKGTRVDLEDRAARGEGSAGIFDHPRQHSDQHDRRRLQSRSLDRLYPRSIAANNTYKEFLEAYQKLGPLDALILDLRSNGGGLLDQAIDLSNFFLPAGEPDRFDRRSARAARRGESHDRRSVYHGKSDRA